jgi:hypothetical protein
MRLPFTLLASPLFFMGLSFRKSVTPSQALRRKGFAVTGTVTLKTQPSQALRCKGSNRHTPYVWPISNPC